MDRFTEQDCLLPASYAPHGALTPQTAVELYKHLSPPGTVKLQKGGRQIRVDIGRYLLEIDDGDRTINDVVQVAIREARDEGAVILFFNQHVNPALSIPAITRRIATAYRRMTLQDFPLAGELPDLLRPYLIPARLIDS